VRIFFCGMEELHGPIMFRIQNKLDPGLEVADLGNVRDAWSAWENKRTNLLVETKSELEGASLMPNKCPLCGQPLPKGVHQHELDTRLKKLASPVLAQERKRMQDDYEAQLTDERKRAVRKAKEQVQQELREAKARAGRAEQDKQKIRRQYEERLLAARKTARQAAEREFRQEFQGRVRKEVAKAVRSSTSESAAQLEKLENERQKDKMRHAAEKTRLQGQLQDLTRRFEARSGERIGSEAEIDLYQQLNQAFRGEGDKIDRIGRGVSGADIVHVVMDGTKIAGRIIYESKDTLDWSHGWITKAKHYQSQYETPHVLIVTRAFPGRQKGLCVEKGIPVVEKRMAISLAIMIREAVIEIARLKLTDSDRDERSQELFDYVVGDKFVTRFREIAEGVASLRNQQQKERSWHENTWEAESKIHARMDGCHRELGAQIRAIVGGSSNGRGLSLAAKA